MIVSHCSNWGTQPAIPGVTVPTGVLNLHDLEWFYCKNDLRFNSDLGQQPNNNLGDVAERKPSECQRTPKSTLSSFVTRSKAVTVRWFCYEINHYLNFKPRATAQVVWNRLLTAKTGVHSQSSPRGTLGRRQYTKLLSEHSRQAPLTHIPLICHHRPARTNVLSYILTYSPIHHVSGLTELP
jgi:hypothetical protein